MTTETLPSRTPSTDTPTSPPPNQVKVGKIDLRTGLPVWRGVVWDEYRDELRSWPTAVKRYKEMQDDVVIGAVLEAIKAPLMATSFEIQPVSDSPDDQNAAEFLRTALFEMPEMEWYEHVEEMLEMLDFGWAISEKVTYKHDSGFLMPALLLPIGQETLDHWGDFDKLGNPTHFFQRTPHGKWLSAPMTKLLHFTWRSRKRSPLGKSVLRSVYRPYLYVKNLESIEGIGAERDVGNTPVATLGPGTYTDNQMKDLEDGLKGLRVDETGYLIVPHGVEINPLGSGGKIWPVRQIIQQWQHLIRQRMFTDFIALGSGSSGSRALAAELTSMFALSLRSIQNKMLAVWNRQLIPWIFEINGVGKQLKKYPRLEWQKPGNKSIMAIAQAVNTLVGADLITPDPNLEYHIREELSLPPITPEQRERIRETAKAEQAALAAPPVARTESRTVKKFWTLKFFA